VAESGDEIRLRDEILELLFWLEGEGFGGHATLEGLMRFLAFPADDVRGALDQLVARGDVSRDHDGLVRLTPQGRPEAARRFADDFAPLMKRGHGECGDPTCECHEHPDAAAECHARVLAGHDRGA
jgi:hypothetical protein